MWKRHKKASKCKQFEPRGRRVMSLHATVELDMQNRRMWENSAWEWRVEYWERAYVSFPWLSRCVVNSEGSTRDEEKKGRRQRSSERQIPQKSFGMRCEWWSAELRPIDVNLNQLALYWLKKTPPSAIVFHCSHQSYYVPQQLWDQLRSE